MKGMNSSGKDFGTIVTLAASLSVGIAAAFMLSVRQINPSLSIELGLGTLAGFIIGIATTFGFCRSLFKSGTTRYAQEKRRIWTLSYAALTTLGVIAAFAFGIKDLSAPKMIEVVIGVTAAAGFLGVIATFFLKVIRFLDEDEKKNSI